MERALISKAAWQTHLISCSVGARAREYDSENVAPGPNGKGVPTTRHLGCHQGVSMQGAVSGDTIDDRVVWRGRMYDVYKVHTRHY